MPVGVYKRTEYHKRINSEGHKGLPGPMKNKKHSEETKKKMSKTHREKEKYFSKEYREKISTFFKGKYINEKSPNWTGNNVTYKGLHLWVKYYRGTPTTCENCKKTGLSGHQIHWANKSHQYKRDLTDWLRLCVKCHKKYDKK